jgi:hypothetical protein
MWTVSVDAALAERRSLDVVYLPRAAGVCLPSRDERLFASVQSEISAVRE